MATTIWTYEIIPEGRDQPLDRGTITGASDFETARRHAQTIVTPTISDKRGLWVKLLDGSGKEVWRGPYQGDR